MKASALQGLIGCDIKSIKKQCTRTDFDLSEWARLLVAVLFGWTGKALTSLEALVSVFNLLLIWAFINCNFMIVVWMDSRQTAMK